MSLNFVTFNQDHSHLAVTTTKGFRIYTTDPFSQVTQDRHGNIAMLEMLFSTSLVATVTQPRRLQLSNTKRGTNICELTFPTTILAVKLNRKRLAIVLEEEIYIYNFADMKLLKIIETSPNPTAICSLSSSSDNCYLAYPSPRKGASSIAAQPSHTPPGTSNAVTSNGDVLLFDATKMQAVNVVTAHKNPLSYVTLNSTGTLLATASDKGTVIRVFSVPDAQKLYQFRRGSMPSRIFCMSFNPTSSLLCVSSATDTVHIFKLVAPPQEGAAPLVSSTNAKPYISNNRDRSLSPSSAENPYDSQHLNDSTQLSSRKHNGTLIGMLRRTSQTVGSSIANVAGGYLPSAVSEIWEPTRDFAWCKIPRPSNLGGEQASLGGSPYVRTVVAMSASSPQVMVVSSTGHFYIFAIDLEKGGEGTLIKVYEIGSEAERMSSSIGDD